MSDKTKNMVFHMHKRSLLERKEYMLFNKITIYIKDALPNSINLNNIIQTIENNIPDMLFYNLETIYIGQFKELEQRDVQAVFLDGAIYVTNEQENEEDMLDDIVHEVAHSVEQMAQAEIYADRELEGEFLRKRKVLYGILTNFDFGFDIELPMFLETEYSKEFDNLLYNSVGYDRLAILADNIFISPYAATSLEEYFAVGFEEYFLGSREEILNISPCLYGKIKGLVAFASEEGFIDDE